MELTELLRRKTLFLFFIYIYGLSVPETDRMFIDLMREITR